MSKLKINKFGIKITEKDQIEEALKVVNGKAWRWVISTHEEIVDRSEVAENMLVQLPKSMRVGATATFYGYAPQVNAYRNSVVSTVINIRRFAEGWRVMAIQKIDLGCKDSRSQKVKVSITAVQHAKIQEVSVRGLDLQEAA